MSYGALYPVDAPLPQQPRHTLLTSANIISDASEDDRWINGVAMRPWPADMPTAFAPCNEGSSAGPKATGTFAAELDFPAFTVLLAGTCTSRGIVNDADFRSRISQLLAVREAWRVEREFAEGPVVSGNGGVYLAEANVAGAPVTPLNGGANTNPTNGLALLERAIADTGEAGMIHAPVEVATYWLEQGHNVHEENGKLVTNLGTIVVPGRGYRGHLPNSTATPLTATALAVYATGLVDIRRSELFLNPTKLSEALDRGNNVVSYWAERYYAFDWDAARLRAYVRIDRCQTVC